MVFDDWAAAVRRQLFLRLDDNYFSLPTTISLWSVGGAERPRGRRAKPARLAVEDGPVFSFSKWLSSLLPQAVGAVGKWESWFWISTFPWPTLPDSFFRAVSA